MPGLEDIARLDDAPAGRECGSPNYELLMALYRVVFAAFHSWVDAGMCVFTPDLNLTRLVQKVHVQVLPDSIRSWRSWLRKVSGLLEPTKTS